MAVKRIVANLSTDTVAEVRDFYQELFELETVMDMGWIATLSNGASMPVQLSIASEGGSGTAVPDLTIEVTDVQEVYARAQNMGLMIAYPLTHEPWGIRRFFLRDPSGRLLNVAEHTTP